MSPLTYTIANNGPSLVEEEEEEEGLMIWIKETVPNNSLSRIEHNSWTLSGLVISQIWNPSWYPNNKQEILSGLFLLFVLYSNLSNEANVTVSIPSSVVSPPPPVVISSSAKDISSPPFAAVDACCAAAAAWMAAATAAACCCCCCAVRYEWWEGSNGEESDFRLGKLDVT